jgi:Protein of unknown function (DUF2442)
MDYVFPGKVVPITGVEVIGDHQLRLSFKDGVVGDIDFRDHDWGGVFEPLADPVCFAQVYVDPEVRTLVWPNGLDMAPEPLYERACEHQVDGSSRIPV